MERAYDLLTDRYVSAHDAAPHPGYLCPCCCGRVHLRPGKVKIPHFAHNQGEGRADCEEYRPGSAAYNSHYAPVGGSPLFVHVDFESGEWTLHLELPPLTPHESRRSAPSMLRSGGIEVHHKGSAPRHVAASVLWPGTGQNAITVPPSRRDIEVKITGKWPTGIKATRWQQTLRGLPPHGMLFVPYRGGSYRRYEWTTPIHWGDRIVFVGTPQARPPQQLRPSPLKSKSTDGTDWSAWLITLPHQANGPFSTWLARFGITVEERRSRTRIVTPAVEYGPDGIPHFYLDELLVVIPSPQATAMVAESHVTISATRLRRRESAPPTAYAVSALEAGTLHIRTDAKQDTVRAEIVNEPSVPMDDFTPVWSVLYGETRLHPFTTYQGGSRTVEIKVVSELPRLAYYLTAQSLTGPEMRYHSVSALDVAEWVTTQLPHASRLTIDAGNLGYVRIYLAPNPSLPPATTDIKPVRRPTWETTYALAAGSASDPSIPHWRFRDRGLRPTGRNDRFMVFE